MKTLRQRSRFAALLLAVVLLLVSCGSTAKATTMHLMRTEGQVGVSDRDGKDVGLMENLGLYSGYGVGTKAESYAWIDLDEVKLTKMDAESEIEIQKDGKKLEILVQSGSLFFNVTKPLAEDETLTIRNSTMAVGIRGTCGWVEVPAGGETMLVYLLEGEAACEADSAQATVKAGEMAAMTTAGEITVAEFTEKDIPEFIMVELTQDEALSEKILAASGLDIQNPPGAEVDRALEAYHEIVSQAASYDYGAGDANVSGYQYALLCLQAEDAVPTLLLKQDTADYMEYVRVFQYAPDTQTVRQPAEPTLMQGMAPVGGYRGGIVRGGNGLIITEMFSGTGETHIQRAWLDGDSLRTEDIWSGFFDQMPDFPTRNISWHDISDLSALDRWDGEEEPLPAIEPIPAAEETVDPAALPTDGNRIVFRGTINNYTHDQVVELQGMPDPNGGGYGETYRIIVLDTPQNMALRSGDGQGSYANEARMVDVTYASGLEQYDGQHLTFSIDPNATYWPSDTSLPLGQPHTSDVHVLS